MRRLCVALGTTQVHPGPERGRVLALNCLLPRRSVSQTCRVGLCRSTVELLLMFF